MCGGLTAPFAGDPPNVEVAGHVWRVWNKTTATADNVSPMITMTHNGSDTSLTARDVSAPTQRAKAEAIRRTVPETQWITSSK